MVLFMSCHANTDYLTLPRYTLLKRKKKILKNDIVGWFIFFGCNSMWEYVVLSPNQVIVAVPAQLDSLPHFAPVLPAIRKRPPKSDLVRWLSWLDV